MKKLKEYLWNKTAITLYLIALVVSILAGIIFKPFYVRFIDGLTVSGLLFLMIGIVLWGQKGKIIDKNSLRLKRFKDGESSNYDDHSQYEYYNEKNRFLAPALLIFMIAVILAATY